MDPGGLYLHGILHYNDITLVSMNRPNEVGLIRILFLTIRAPNEHRQV